jgi:hypothetical protein
MHDVHREANDGLQAPALQTVHAALLDVRSKIVGLVRAWSQSMERYADLRSRARTPGAEKLIAFIRDGIEQLERKGNKRVRERREKSGAKFSEAIERFVGDLLRARAGTSRAGRIYRAIGKMSFDDDPVKYDVFTKVLEGLKGLELIGHLKGQSRYRKTPFGAVQLPGLGARFWATENLLTLAEHCGIDRSNVGEHFAPEPPKHPLVLKDYATGRGRNKESGRSVKYDHTPETERLEADVRELNDFLAPFELMGGEHTGYIRVFNNRAWDKGGRLYSVGKHSYQQITEADRIKMRINGEPVAEIDIKASQLTIYHAMVGKPLKGSSDPYAAAGVDRLIGKLWTLASFGNTKPATRWPPKMVEDYRQETGKDLGKEAKARDVGRKMLEALPALEELKDHCDIWADLQFREAEAVIGTMLVLMRQHGVPSLSMHDGIIVPKSKADLAATILAKEFHRVVGVEPVLTVDALEPEVASDL